jgi:hypothetical protein
MCGREEETSVHILFESEALAALRHAYLGSFCFNPEDIRVLNLGTYGNVLKKRTPLTQSQGTGHKEPVLSPRCIVTARALTQRLIKSNLPSSYSPVVQSAVFLSSVVFYHIMTA